jgi:hypothetical protein
MERYYDKNNEDEDDDDEKEPFFGNEESDPDDVPESIAAAQLSQQGIIDIMHVEIAQTELNQALLSKAMEIARQSWWW